MSKELINVELNNDGFITSVELVDIINHFREEEFEILKDKGLNKKNEVSLLLHKNFMAKINKELEVLETLGLRGELNFKLGSYKDKQNQERPCYMLNRDGMLQMLNSESTIVRAKTIEYINKLENKIKQLSTPSYMIEDPIERAKAWIKEQEEKKLLDEQNKKLELENTQQKQVIGELKPKADYTDIILKCKDTVTVTQISKDYGMSAKALNNILHDLKIQYKQSGQWFLYSKYQESGYTKSNTVTYTKNDGTQGCKMNTKWTQKGRLFLYNKLKEQNILPLIEQ